MSQGFSSFTRPAAVQAGIIAQIVRVEDGAVATGTTQTPLNDTIPQITEGNQFMTLDITPTSATSTLKIDVVALVSANSSSRWLITHLHKDSDADAIASMMEFMATSTEADAAVFTHYMTAGTTSSITFTVRAGASASATTTFNGTGGAAEMGGTLASSITITEIREGQPIDISGAGYSDATTGLANRLSNNGLVLGQAGSDFEISHISGGITGEDISIKRFLTNQIRFPSTQVAASNANALDDYEEGTWTPFIADNDGSDSESQTYSTQSGTYSKTGNQVTVSGRCYITSLGTLTGSHIARIGGFPFIMETGYYAALTFGFGDGYTNANVCTPAAYLISATAFATTLLFDTSSASTSMILTELSANGRLLFACTYTTTT